MKNCYDCLVKARVNKCIKEFVHSMSLRLGCSESECIRKILFNAYVRSITENENN